MAFPKRLLLIGANGLLGRMVQESIPAHYDLATADLPKIDFLRPDTVAEALRKMEPEIVINCAAHTAVDACESEEAAARRINGDGPGLLAALARETRSVLVHISSDYVFDGDSAVPYREEDPPAPRCAYGRSKLAGERAILESGLERFFIVRTSWLYGPHGKNFVETVLRLAAEREELRIVSDQVGSPTLTDDLALALFRLLETDRFGIYHFSNEGSCSWHEFASAIVEGARARGQILKVREIKPIRTDEYPLPARRPPFSLLAKDKYRSATGCEVPHWRVALNRYLDRRFGSPEGK
ncbi:MAG: dTDP-4-dehydrorhamnose reductase [Deltaproteobacteria bacterium]|nr:dTDP-4-dehydrorhamnose reductase [Deltaproteobacteria bacterium]